MFRLSAAVAIALGLGHAAEAQEWSASRVDSHAPIGVMGDHLHEGGEMMLSFRYMRMAMDGNRLGTDPVGPDDVLQSFPVTPLRMPMQMFMAGVMYAPSDRITLMGMVPIRDLSMDHRTRTGLEFTTSAAGVGDVGLTALIGLAEPERQRVHLHAGVRLPTGDIDRRDATPASSDALLPYPMQLGGGTWNLEPGVTWLGQGDAWSWGAQGMATLRLGENERDYHLGHTLALTGWWARVLAEWASASARLAFARTGDVEGADPELNPLMVPTADPDRRAGRRLDVALGVNLYARGGPVNGHRLAIEAAWPLYQDLDGPQLESDWAVTLGWQKAFDVLP